MPSLAFALVSALLLTAGAAAMEMGGGSAPTETCISTPATPSCAGYVYPETNATADVDSLCTAMPFMTGCSVAGICRSGGASAQALAAGGYCTGMSLLADTCVSDDGMSMMRGCRSYNSMCNATAGSVVAACAANPPLPGLPTTDEVNAAVKSICTEMTMPGCEKCSYAGGVTYANCDLLAVYSDLCIQMPTMSQCTIHTSMCKQQPIGATTLCTSNADGYVAPSMIMYFHGGIRDYFLSYTWVPNNVGQFVASLLAVFAFGVGSIALSILRDLLSTLARRLDLANPAPSLTRRLKAASYRFIGTLLSSSAAYIIMLVVMNFNVWVFVAAMLGLATGEAVLGWLRFEGPGHAAVTAVAGKMVVNGKDSPDSGGACCSEDKDEEVVVMKSDCC
ncbi:Ctr copper transporter family-domain-containing protein [Hyaloraphidium curvatum]|nr:Ctr copper transporter family-domain-containing protein [Hyaloraphidium curvatum]